MKTLVTAVCWLALTMDTVRGVQPEASPLSEKEAAFVKLMSGCKMVGSFTTGHGGDRPPKEESYTISKVSKVEADRWRFTARIAYGTRDVTVPIVVDVRWAGDTPMIQVTDMTIPLLGTYTARVVVYGEQYAGMWSGGEHGGHMYGRIERAPAEAISAMQPVADVAEPVGQPSPDDWTNWRGPFQHGEAPKGNPPVEWSEDKNIAWKIDLPGDGCSTPIVLGDRIYVMSAIETDRAGKPTAPSPPRREGRGGRGGGRGNAPPPTTYWEFVVLALDRNTGKVIWSTKVKEEVPHEGGHRTGSQASGSPVTDGQHIYAYFGSRGMFCLDLEGKVKWSKDIATLWTRNQFGEGTSPTLHGDTLVVTCDHEGESFILALDKRTGDERWRQRRDESTSWATPVVAAVDGGHQVIITGTKASRGYDLATGKELWTLGGMTTNCIPSPIVWEGVAYLMSGFRGAALQAVRLEGARGDLAGGPHVLWEHDRSTSYVPSALLYEGHIYFVRSNSGVLTCLDAKTGRVLYEGARMEGLRTIYATPVAASDRIYITSREGLTKVLQSGPKYGELAHNTLDDVFDASAVIVGDRIYLRGRKHLYCIGAKD